MEKPKCLGASNDITFTGSLMPMYPDGTPFTIRNPYYRESIILVFSTIEKLEASMKQFATLVPDGYKIKQVTDGPDFVASIFENDNVVIFYDLRTADNGKERWSEVTRGLWSADPSKYN